MAPELVRQIQHHDQDGPFQYNAAAADCWSLGAVLYFAATGSSLAAAASCDSSTDTDTTAAAQLSHLAELHSRWQVSSAY